jgi:hypothetical protein
MAMARILSCADSLASPVGGEEVLRAAEGSQLTCRSIPEFCVVMARPRGGNVEAREGGAAQMSRGFCV